MSWKLLVVPFLYLLLACEAQPKAPTFQKSAASADFSSDASYESENEAYSDFDTSPYLHEVTWLTSHNAFVNNKDSNWLAPNQNKSLAEQLNDGVAGLMLDVYTHEGKLVLCHGKCTGIPGLFPRQDFATAMNTITSFLYEQPEAIVTLFLEDYTSGDEMKAALQELPDVEALLFDPYANDVINNGWPRIGEMIAADKRLLIISDKEDKKGLGIGFAQDLTVENYWSTGFTGSDLKCKSRWDNVPLDQTDAGFQRLFVMNHFRDVPFSGASSSDNRFEFIWKRIETECMPVAQRKPNFLAVDFYESAEAGPQQAVEKLNSLVP